ncbi:MAG TPA: LssY C-terminal domain-containing protein [Gemmatimonadales bacterium]|nr:LssY C-terminal domain-containing protein [Gemmatimonadales bacterium]
MRLAFSTVALLALLATDVTVPAGTHIPIRFVQRITSGRDTVGTAVLVQTMGALVRESCVVVPPYVRAQGRIVVSKRGGRFGRHGRLGLRFDSLEVRPGRWVPISGVLDTLEYAKRGTVTDSGVVSSGKTSAAGVGKKLVPAGVAAAVDLDGIPVAVLGGFSLIRRGPPVRILAGELGGIRLTEPLVLPGEDRCDSVTAHRDLTELPALPRFVPRSENRTGTALGDPFNVLLLGNEAEIDSAFRAAAWLPAQKRSFATVTREITAAIASRPAITAPVSTQYFEGRPQDLAYELAGPNVRIRHHIRIWLLDTLSLVWVGAANKDVGVIFKPWEPQATHRIESHIDWERDRVVHDLEASGCGDLLDYMTLPGAVTEARNVSGQKVVSDGRTAVVRLRACGPPITP